MRGIILASKSAARCSMLENAGVIFRACPADIDEESIIQQSLPVISTDQRERRDLRSLDYARDDNNQIKSITEKLAALKALHVSKQYPNCLVIGSDQTLEFNGELISKSKTKQQAAEKLKQLRGATHSLNSSVCVALGGEIIFSSIDTSDLTMHNFDDEFLANYMDKDPDALLSCVGGYKIEGTGAMLFSSVKGDFFTIMGMPLLPLLGFLRDV